MIIAIGNIIGKSGGFRTDGNVPVNTIAPVISGTAEIGNTLTSTTGTWTSDTGVIGYLYQWYRGATLISGATNSTYVLTFADAGFNMTCRVAATDTDGTSAYVSSNSILFRSFDFTIKTDNLSTGSSTNTQFALPLVSTGTYNFVVNWGDGTSNTITTWNQAETTKTYSSIGTYNISITGTLVGWRFNNTGDRLKLLSINSWGNLRLGTTQGGYFYGCTNLTLTSVSDVLNLTGTTSLVDAFRGCASITTINRINEWDVSNVINMTVAFGGMPLFNQNIGAWNVSNVTTFNYMFSGANAFNNGGSSSIGNWILKTTGTVSLNGMFQGALAFNQPIGTWNTSAVTSMPAMFDSATAFNQNIGNWNVSNVTNFTNFMAYKSSANFSATNLDAIYNGWSSRPVKPNLSISFGTAKYTLASQAGKNILTGAPNNWSITDGGI